MKKIALWLLFFGLAISARAQSYFDDGLPASFHKERREAARAALPENAVMIVFTNPVKNRSNDTEFAYRPDSDFYYLTGFREPNAALVLFQQPQQIGGKTYTELLYVQRRDAAREQWEGTRLGVEGVQEKLGIEAAFLYESFLQEPGPINLGNFSQVVYKDLGPIEAGHNKGLIAMTSKLKEGVQENPFVGQRTFQQVMSGLREVKTAEELVLLRKAVAISGEGHRAAIQSIKPGVSERAIQGVHEFVHKAFGAEDVGYGSIVGAGNNATILHYVYNSERDLRAGLMLMDVGAEYRGYSGDITRTVPISGTFTEEEKLIYELVLASMEAAFQEIKPGVSFRAASAAASEVINTGLADLGIIKKGERHRYFPHGLGHHLGLDVHDRGGYDPLKPGMVLTVEPGIYIPEGSDCDPKWWGIGVRIEDNLLITESGFENLSEFVPKTVADIEELMRSEGVLQKLYYSVGANSADSWGGKE